MKMLSEIPGIETEIILSIFTGLHNSVMLVKLIWELCASHSYGRADMEQPPLEHLALCRQPPKPADVENTNKFS